MDFNILSLLCPIKALEKQSDGGTKPSTWTTPTRGNYSLTSSGAAQLDHA